MRENDEGLILKMSVLKLLTNPWTNRSRGFSCIIPLSFSFKIFKKILHQHLLFTIAVLFKGEGYSREEPNEVSF